MLYDYTLIFILWSSCFVLAVHSFSPRCLQSAVTKTSEGCAADDLAGSKDEDDDDNDDDDEKGPAGHNYDPERLKAFNVSAVYLFCVVLIFRLFL